MSAPGRHHCSPSAGAARAPHEAAFTFIEVICILLVMTFGLLSVVGLVSYGASVASRSQGATSGLPTAMSLAIDPRPLLEPAAASSWDYTPYDMDSAAPLVTATAKGYLNGFYVERTETTRAEDIISREGTTVYSRSATVAVEVYETVRGNSVASYTTQIVRQRGRQ